MDQEDDLSLPADTLQILNEFLVEKAHRQQMEIAHIQSQIGKEAEFEEDWQLSQFWYNAATKTAIGKAVHSLSSDNNNFTIALLSCPSLYRTVKEMTNKKVKIFEYDKRFAAFGEDFVFYDFNEASSDYLKEYFSTFDLIIADPPFLAEECIYKMATIITNLKKISTKVIFCSGEIVEPWLTQALSLKRCDFCPEHERNLGNNFACYANFDLDVFINKQNLK